jgi:hypothetical protein
MANHREARRTGREGILRDQRLRVASVVRDCGTKDREWTPGSPANSQLRMLEKLDIPRQNKATSAPGKVVPTQTGFDHAKGLWRGPFNQGGVSE